MHKDLFEKLLAMYMLCLKHLEFMKKIDLLSLAII